MHFHDRFERFFSPRTLLELNVLFIIAAEALGAGRLFFDTGLVYVPVILFSFVLTTRIAVRFTLFDPMLKAFLHSCLASLTFLLFANVLMFCVQNLDLELRTQTLYGAVIALQIVALLLLAHGTLAMLTAYGVVSEAAAWILVATIASVAIVTIVVTEGPLRTSLTSPFTFVMIALSVGIGETAALLALANRAPVFAKAMRLLVGATLLIAAGAAATSTHLTNATYNGTAIQATYVSQFLYFIALTLLFLGIGAFVDLGETYKNARRAALARAGRRAANRSAQNEKPAARGAGGSGRSGHQPRT